MAPRKNSADDGIYYKHYTEKKKDNQKMQQFQVGLSYFTEGF